MNRFDNVVAALIEVGRYADQRGWVPATSGNFSVRLDDGEIAITVSGAHKGRLGPADVMRVDMHGLPREDKRPSAETLLHAQLYRHDADIACVLHTHSVNATVLSRLQSGSVHIEQMEVLKAFPGIGTHQTDVEIPVFDNDQDMERLSLQVEERLRAGLAIPAYLLAGHGLYTWGDSVAATLRHLEALEFLFQCELEIRRLKA